MKALDTKQGTNLKAGVWGYAAVAGPIVMALPEPWMKLLAFETLAISLVIINWKTTGSGLSQEEAEAIKTKVEDLTGEELLEEGRN